MTSDQTFVIVGASLAGAKAAETLREEGFDGRVVLVGAEDERPYERPPLSKDYLRGEVGREKVYVHDEGFYAEHDIELRLGRTRGRAWTLRARELTLDDGERLRYDRLLLATGAEPRRLAIPGGELDGVLYLRSVEDSDALRERLDRGGAVVVVGAGWIGAEVAASARQRGLDVTVIEPAVGPARARARRRGRRRSTATSTSITACRCCSGTGVEALRGRTARRARPHQRRTRARVRLRRRRRRRAAAHRAGRRRPGIAVDNGILVDEHLQTSAPGVFAAGDVANAHHPFYGERIRVEHWANALHQGPVAARTMLGQRDRLRPPAVLLLRPVRRRHGVHGLRPRPGTASSFRGDPASREFIAFWLAGDRVVAGMNVNVWDVTDPIQRLIRERVAVDDRRLADPDVAARRARPGRCRRASA